MFAPGHVLSLAKVEAGDGLSHTAAFSERLVGDNQPHHVTPFNYEVVPGPVSSSGWSRRAPIQLPGAVTPVRPGRRPTTVSRSITMPCPRAATRHASRKTASPLSWVRRADMSAASTCSFWTAPSCSCGVRSIRKSGRSSRRSVVLEGLNIEMHKHVLIFDFGNVIAFFDYVRACELLW